MLQKCSMWDTAGVFFKEPSKSHYLMDISRRMGLAHTSLKRNLKLLLKQGIIREAVEKRGSRKFPVYSANLSSPVYKAEKRMYNIATMMDSGLVEFLDSCFMPGSIVLFGSFARGEDVESSDVDLYLQCKEKRVELKSFEAKLGRKVQLHFKEDFQSLPKAMKNNIINGIVLKGYLEL